MKLLTSNYKILISGGGTGGHIFSAIAIAEEFYHYLPNVEFLFIGAKNKMEMQKIPEAGFSIKGIGISGINRSSIKNNFFLPFQLISSLWECYKIIKEFKPNLAIGTGGFVSGPTLLMANWLRIPIFIQEQNSIPGITNKLLSKKAEKIFVAYESMEKFFPMNRIYLSGNPIRKSLINSFISQKQAKIKLGLNVNKKCIFSIGGSLGSYTLNTFWEKNLQKIPLDKIDIIWQTGLIDFYKYKKFMDNSIKIIDFITNISLFYSAADLIISRSGAIAISELCFFAKPIILIPFPFSSEDHQGKNADYLVSKNAAIKILDCNVEKELLHKLFDLMQNTNKQYELKKNLKKLAKYDASKNIVNEIIKFLKI